MADQDNNNPDDVVARHRKNVQEQEKQRAKEAAERSKQAAHDDRQKTRKSVESLVDLSKKSEKKKEEDRKKFEELFKQLSGRKGKAVPVQEKGDKGKRTEQIQEQTNETLDKLSTVLEKIAKEADEADRKQLRFTLKRIDGFIEETKKNIPEKEITEFLKNSEELRKQIFKEFKQQNSVILRSGRFIDRKTREWKEKISDMGMDYLLRDPVLAMASEQIQRGKRVSDFVKDRIRQRRRRKERLERNLKSDANAVEKYKKDLENPPDGISQSRIASPITRSTLLLPAPTEEEFKRMEHRRSMLSSDEPVIQELEFHSEFLNLIHDEQIEQGKVLKKIFLSNEEISEQERLNALDQLEEAREARREQKASQSRIENRLGVSGVQGITAGIMGGNASSELSEIPKKGSFITRFFSGLLDSNLSVAELGAGFFFRNMLKKAPKGLIPKAGFFLKKALPIVAGLAAFDTIQRNKTEGVSETADNVAKGLMGIYRGALAFSTRGLSELVSKYTGIELDHQDLAKRFQNILDHSELKETLDDLAKGRYSEENIKKIIEKENERLTSMIENGESEKKIHAQREKLTKLEELLLKLKFENENLFRERIANLGIIKDPLASYNQEFVDSLIEERLHKMRRKSKVTTMFGGGKLNEKFEIRNAQKIIQQARKEAIGTRVPRKVPGFKYKLRHPELAPLINAIVQVESAGNPNAVSKAGAQGLMQIMPQMQVALGVKDPFDPQQSITGGESLIGEELDRYQDLRVALAAYNAGSPAVNNAIRIAGKTRKTATFEDILPHIPRETKLYVPKVISHLTSDDIRSAEALAKTGKLAQEAERNRASSIQPVVINAPQTNQTDNSKRIVAASNGGTSTIDRLEEQSRIMGGGW